MILAFIGGVLVVIGIGTGNVPVIIVGAVLVVLGLLTIGAMDEHNRASNNRRRYWAYGDKPDWKVQQERKAANTVHLQAKYIGRDGKRGLMNGAIYGITVTDNRFEGNGKKNYIVNAGGVSIGYGLKSSMESDWEIL